MNALNFGVGGECFVPIIPSMHLADLARAIDPQAKFKVIGIRPGEKLHESLISEDEGYNTRIYKNMYVILPQFFENKEMQKQYESAKRVPEGFIYRSDLNKELLTVAKLREIIVKLP